MDPANGVTFHRITPAPGGYLYDGAMRPYTVRDVALKVRRPDGGVDTDAFQVLSTGARR